MSSVVTRLRCDERGTSLVLIVLSLVVLLGFAAVAIDGAASWALRRQDQSGADIGSLAGALFTADKTKDAAIAAATTEVIRITYDTLQPDMTLAAWTTEWVNCADANKPAKFTEGGLSPCISFTSNLNTIRVQTPEVPWPTTFGRIIGVDEINTSAAAEAETEFLAAGGVLPFGMPANAAGSPEICLKTGANPKTVPPCDGPETGNFGFLDFTQFGDGDTISAICQGGNDRLETNIARGVDHPLGIADAFPAADPRVERDSCNDGNSNSNPNIVQTETGNIAQALDDGFVDGTSTGFPGRLTQSTDRTNVRGSQLDDKPLREFWSHQGSAGIQ